MGHDTPKLCINIQGQAVAIVPVCPQNRFGQPQRDRQCWTVTKGRWWSSVKFALLSIWECLEQNVQMGEINYLRRHSWHTFRSVILTFVLVFSDRVDVLHPAGKVQCCSIVFHACSARNRPEHVSVLKTVHTWSCLFYYSVCLLVSCSIKFL